MLYIHNNLLLILLLCCCRFCKELVQVYNLHTFDICLPGNAGPGTDKTNPREDKCVTHYTLLL